MGILIQRIAQAQQTNVLAYNSKAAMMQEYMVAFASTMRVRASMLNIADYVNRGHNGENCALLYTQFCAVNGFECAENILKVLR